MLKKIESKIGKLKLKISNLEIKFLSNNHRYQLIKIGTPLFSLSIKNKFNYYFDSHKIKLCQTICDLKIPNLAFYSGNNNPLLELPTFSFSFSNEVIYLHEKRELNEFGNFVCEVPNMDIVLLSVELQKILEIILCIDEGLDKLKLAEKIVHNTKAIEQYQSTIVFNYKIYLSIILYDEFVQVELNETVINININSPKFYANIVNINFDPIMLSVCNKSKFSKVSTLFLKELHIKFVGDHNRTNSKLLF